MRRSIGIQIALLLLLSWPAAVARAFTCETTSTGVCLRWASGGATLLAGLGSGPQSFIDPSAGSFDEVVLQAANDWNAAGAQFGFTVQPAAPPTISCSAGGPVCGPPGFNPVFFASSVCGGGSFGDIVAETTTCYDDSSGAMGNALVFVNSTVPWNVYNGALIPGINDLRRVLLHEFGHALGLGHTTDPSAIMYPQESDVFQLGQDDLNGVRFLYPNTAPPTTNPASPTTGCQMSPPANPAGSAALLIVPLFLLATRRRRSPRREA